LAAVRGHREPTIWICNAVILNTVEVLRRRGPDLREHEGVAYWAGKRIGPDSIVTTCVAPATATTHGSFHTTSEANARVIMYLAKVDLELVAQVHSHPGVFVNHSPGDDERALMPYVGFYSIVVPNYAEQGMCPLARCGVHIFDKNGFRRLASFEVESRFHVVEDFADLRVE
jgi:proteasome lid subunit RPN8/RPN11